MIKKLFLLLLLGTTLFGDKPKFELGLGVASLYYPNYIGSTTTQVVTLPLPYVRYRGDYIRIDKDGLSGKLFGVKDLRLELSVNGSLPASSEENGVRVGMPDLDLTGEIGPKLVYNIFEQGVSLLEFELPVRAVLSTDFKSINYVGVVTSPQLKYSLNYEHIEWTFKTSVSFANQDYHNHFYGVKSQYSTPTRETYNAQNGFSGFRNKVGVTYQKESWWMGAFVSHFDISEAVFKESPLVQTHDAFYMGFGVAYIFYTID